MFGVSVPEILLVCVVILIVLGPERLPGAARTFGDLLAQFRRQADAVRREIYNSVYVPTEDFRNDFKEASQELQAVKRRIDENMPEELMTCEDRERLAEQRREENASKENSEGDASES